LAHDLIQRLRNLFLAHDVILPGTQNEVVINKCLIRSYPGNHLDALRSRVDLKIVIIDELDFIMRQSESAILRDVVERYLAKSSPWIIGVSTPGHPDGLLAQMEAEEGSIYRKVVMDYRVALNKIFTPEEIAIARRNPAFPREYECRFLGGIGNCFKHEAIETALDLGRKHCQDPVSVDKTMACALGLDPAWGSSNFGICIVGFAGENSPPANILKRWKGEGEFDQAKCQTMRISPGSGDYMRVDGQLSIS
jgi:hypothetical protein